MIRAKFWVQSVLRWNPGDKPSGGNVTLIPVYSTDPAHENKQFWDATPSGKIELSISNPAAYEEFQAHVGREMFVDFTRA